MSKLGTWDVTARSVAGFRLQETFIGLGNDVVGRTSDVTGTISVSDNRVILATLHIDLTTIKVGGKTEPQLATSFDTRKYPNATFNLSRPVMLSSTFASGATITETRSRRAETAQPSRSWERSPSHFLTGPSRSQEASAFSGRSPTTVLQSSSSF